jgi:hypothetical protein
MMMTETMSADGTRTTQRRCDHCGGALGVYEPIVVVGENKPRGGLRSWLSESLTNGTGALHELCALEHE